MSDGNCTQLKSQVAGIVEHLSNTDHENRMLRTQVRDLEKRVLGLEHRNTMHGSKGTSFQEISKQLGACFQLPCWLYVLPTAAVARCAALAVP